MRETAIQAAREAGDVLMMSFRKNLEAKRKSSGQLVTEADIKSEKRIIESISNEFPEHSILSEEAGGKVTDLDGRSWSPYKGQLVATNGKAHSKIIEYLRGSSFQQSYN